MLAGQGAAEAVAKIDELGVWGEEGMRCVRACMCVCARTRALIYLFTLPVAHRCIAVSIIPW